MSRPRHPDKHIERAVEYAEHLGWSVRLSNGHAWGRIYLSRAEPRWLHHQHLVDAAQS